MSKKQVVNFDGEVVVCYKVTEAKQWSLVGKVKYRKLQNDLITVSIDTSTVPVSFDPKLSKEDFGKGTSLSSLGLGYEILVDRKKGGPKGPYYSLANKFRPFYGVHFTASESNIPG